MSTHAVLCAACNAAMEPDHTRCILHEERA